MPPKGGKKTEPSKKTEQKKKDKVIEDKTFGLKNKKGAKQQKFIQHVTKQVQTGNKSAREMDLLNKDKLTKREQKKKEQDELNALFRPVEQKVSKGTDPKSVLCAFFKQGLCTKGDKCKFSHDVMVGRKAEKRSMYDDGKEENKDTMDDWDEQKLEEVVNKKHGEKNKAMPKTAIICKYFLDAVENSKYGWFWTCPNGDACHYRHQLPSGFVLKKDRKKMDDQKDDGLSLEELIETERAALSSKNLTKVTLETFLKWKERKRKEKIAKAKSATDKKKNDFKMGKTHGISGREMFEFNPDLVIGDDDEAADTVEREVYSDDEDESVAVKEINLEALDSLAQEVDGSGTVAAAATSRVSNGLGPGGAGDTDESGKLDMAGALPADTASAPDLGDEAAIDENLFDGEDLDLVEEELEGLELDD